MTPSPTGKIWRGDLSTCSFRPLQAPRVWPVSSYNASDAVSSFALVLRWTLCLDWTWMVYEDKVESWTIWKGEKVSSSSDTFVKRQQKAGDTGQSYGAVYRPGGLDWNLGNSFTIARDRWDWDGAGVEKKRKYYMFNFLFHTCTSQKNKLAHRRAWP